MDDFLMEIHADIFFIYLVTYDYPDIENIKVSEDTIELKTKYAKATITKNANSIFEFQVMNVQNNSNEFYLHFQMKNLSHALGLFKEMMDVVCTLKHQPKIKVLLVCSSGLTTTLFANDLKTSAEILHLDYTFEAVAFTKMDSIADEFDIILLAPQISYHHGHLQGKYPTKIVLKIPPAVFAKYDTGSMLQMIEETQKIYQKKQKEAIILKEVQYSHDEILAIALIRNSQKIHVAYRLFSCHSEVLEEGETIKTTLSIDDLFDVVDVMMLKHRHIKAVVMALPGVINDGIISSTGIRGLEGFVPIEKAFNKRYYQRLFLINDVNSVAVGYHACQNKYHSISVIFQPISTNAGVGHIINDKLNVGYKSLSGEMKYQPLQLSGSRLELNKSVQGTVELLTQQALSIIACIAPEAIVLCSQLLPSANDVKEALKQYLPEEYIPHITRVSFLQDYALIGGYMTALKQLNKTED